METIKINLPVSCSFLPDWKSYQLTGLYGVLQMKKKINKESIRRASMKYAKKNPLRRVYSDILSRCFNVNNRYYHRYGGRGISMCQLWKDSYALFESDMLDGYKKGLQIDRIDNDGDYCPENCKWSTPMENSRNKSDSKYWFINGVRYETSKEAGEAHGVSGSSAATWCDGYYKYGRYHGPKENCYSIKRSDISG